MKSLKGMKIALVGGAGFIGHNLALYLKKQEADVYVIDGLNVNSLLYLHSTDHNVPHRERYINFVEQRLKLLRDNDIPVYVEDVRNYDLLGMTMKKAGIPNAIVLLAAVAHANRSNKDPYSTFDHSLRTLENALDCSRDTIGHFIYFSSSMAYGHFPAEGVIEETPLNPLDIYGNLKSAGEQMVKAYNNVFGLPYTILRPSALYGERCISRRVAQIFIENALAGDPIEVNGDGSDRLDFTYIDDLVHGVECVLTNENSINQTFNLTYGESRSIAELTEILKQYVPEVKINYKEKDRLMPERGTLIVDKAKELIGYNPQWPIDKGIPKYIEWYKENVFNP